MPEIVPEQEQPQDPHAHPQRSASFQVRWAVPLFTFIANNARNFVSYRCAENGCSAAFTTKQCLQFHYKKVHGYAQDQMPKIERSIAYTFDAYSGGMKVDFLGEFLGVANKSTV